MHHCLNDQHNNSQIIMMCIGESCKSCKLLCDKCLQQDLHLGHNKDLIKITELPDFLKQKQKDCNDLINYLQQQMDYVQNKLNKLKQGIRQKYELDVGRLQSINISQIDQAIEEMINFENVKKLTCQKTSEGTQNIIQLKL